MGLKSTKFFRYKRRVTGYGFWHHSQNCEDHWALNAYGQSSAKGKFKSLGVVKEGPDRVN